MRSVACGNRSPADIRAISRNTGVEPAAVDEVADDPRPRHLLQIRTRLAGVDAGTLDLSGPNGPAAGCAGRARARTLAATAWPPVAARPRRGLPAFSGARQGGAATISRNSDSVKACRVSVVTLPMLPAGTETFAAVGNLAAHSRKLGTPESRSGGNHSWPSSPAAPPGSPRRLRSAAPLRPCPVAGRPGRRAPARRPRWWGCDPPPAPGRPPAARQPPAAAPRRAAPTLAVRVDGPDGIQVCALPRRLGRVPPAVLHRGPQPRRRGDRHVVLAGRVPQDFQHLGGARRAGGHERGVGRVQPVPADHLSLCGSLR